MAEYKVIGLMSGTSLDGVDIAYCIIFEDKDKWSFNIEIAETIPYNAIWKETLSDLENSTAFNFISVHKKYGRFLGNLVRDFIEKHKISLDFIASHGHTIFHQPEKKITCQIGDGAAIAAQCGRTVVCDFRSLDVAHGGQGAPLVPIGDKLLFSGFEYCLNLGGFANISFENKGNRMAFDICPVNIILNKLASLMGKEFDNKGKLAAKGKLDQALLNDLNNIEYYSLKPPKSLGKEWTQKYISPIIDKYKIPCEDKLHTFCEHAAMQISKVVSHGKMIVTGGGAYNDFLISRIKAHSQPEIIIPDKMTVEFKEALIFAFLGVLRITNRINCLSSVTGAVKDNIGGAVYLG